MKLNDSAPELNNFPHQVFFAVRQALRRHTGGSGILIGATVLALLVANLPVVNDLYFKIWNLPVRLQIGDFNVFSHGGEPMSMLAFINDALMAIFFFTIGLEIKREVLVGELSSFKQALLPILAAVGGMIVPVVIFSIMAAGTDFARGSAIPMATDIAFSLGVLAMLGRRVPISLKIFLTTLAVVDDIGGIIVIALFYSTHIDVTLLLYAFGLLVIMSLGSMFYIRSKAFYVVIGGVVWFLFLNSGVHPTIAGVLVAFCVPATPVFAPARYIKVIRESIAHFRKEDDEVLAQRTFLNKDQMNWLKQIESASDKVISPLQDLEDMLHPVVNYMIIPLFAFANAGIYLFDVDPMALTGGISLAVVLGLLLGKFLGIFIFSWSTVKMGLAPMPQYSNWKMIASVAMLGGIGFTVSLFIANLSFGSMGQHGVVLLNEAKLGIVIGSVLSGFLGYLMLKKTLPRAEELPEEAY